MEGEEAVRMVTVVGKITRRLALVCKMIVVERITGRSKAGVDGGEKKSG